MSASSKKKLRKEQNLTALTEKQRAQQKEAKKLKAQSAAFLIIMLAVVITFVAVIGITLYKNIGIKERMTIAAVVDEHELNTVEMNYYFKDAINATYSEWYSSYGEYTDQLVSWTLNLDTTKPIDEQTRDDGTTWADYFMDMALENAKSNYAIYDLATSEGYTLSEEDEAAIDENIEYMGMYAQMYGFNNINKYLQAIYGAGSTQKSYKEYMIRSSIAQAYYDDHYETLKYEDADIRAYEEDKYTNYSSYNFALYHIDYNTYLPEGEKDEDGNVTHTSEQIGAAKDQAYADAEALAKATNLDELNAAIAALAINAEKETAPTATESKNVLFTALPETYSEWLSDSERKENDIVSIPDEVTEEDEDGNEVTSVNGYYVILFQSREENEGKMSNVRHLLVKFAGGTTDDEGNTTYSDEDKAAAKEKAEGYLKTWKEGAATEESFIELVKAHSEDTSAETGGLFENINRDSNYVPNFLSWSIDESRKEGDCEVIETEYGYHVMYYSGNSELSYRDFLITNDLRTEDLEAWYNEVVGAYTAVFGDLSLIDTHLILSQQQG
ncbi:MAG: peptidylprolyl isomerase [Oscillospiraceae bacterium]|nr:peptidylprolyl isomerase [Oscillospiraceae bacterium]